MEDVGNMNPLLRTLLEMVSEEQISEIPRHGLENLLLVAIYTTVKFNILMMLMLSLLPHVCSFLRWKRMSNL